MKQKWEKFLETGKVEDYLEYSRIKKEILYGKNWKENRNNFKDPRL